MEGFDNIKARYMILRAKIAGSVNLYNNQKLLAEIQLLIKDLSRLLEENRRKAKTAQVRDENEKLVVFREYLQKQLN